MAIDAQAGVRNSGNLREASAGGKAKGWTDCLVNELQMFGIGTTMGGKTDITLEPGKWFVMVIEGDRTFMAGRKRRKQLNLSGGRWKRKSRARLFDSGTIQTL